MTRLFRCSGGHHFNVPARESLKFLSDIGERASIIAYISFPSPILEVFDRGPIPFAYQTRFGPPFYQMNPLYVASDTDTTFYEYGFHLLASKAFGDEELKLTCFELNCTLSGNIANPTTHQNVAQILNTSIDYKVAQDWLKNLNPPPEIVSYPSVRHPSSNPPQTGMNYAIYRKDKIEQIINQSPFLIKLDNLNKSFAVYDTLSDWMVRLSPKV